MTVMSDVILIVLHRLDITESLLFGCIVFSVLWFRSSSFYLFGHPVSVSNPGLRKIEGLACSFPCLFTNVQLATS